MVESVAKARKDLESKVQPPEKNSSSPASKIIDKLDAQTTKLGAQVSWTAQRLKTSHGLPGERAVVPSVTNMFKIGEDERE